MIGMTSVFNKIHRLKQQPGWTWDRFLTEIAIIYPTGLDEKTLYAHYRSPHRNPNSHVSHIIDQLHEQYFPDPFPAAINALMRLYNNLIDCRRHLNKDQAIDDLEVYVKHQLTREPIDQYGYRARWYWLLGNIYFDRIPLYRERGQRDRLNEIKQQAIEFYQSAVDQITQHNSVHTQPVIGPIYAYKAHQNILACYVNAVNQAVRPQDDSILRYLRESDYLQNCKDTLQAEPFQWEIARNGLRCSSLLQQRENVMYFFTTLVNASARFIDLNYEPLNYGSIQEANDFQWAINNVLTPTYLASLQATGQRKRR